MVGCHNVVKALKKITVMLALKNLIVQSLATKTSKYKNWTVSWFEARQLLGPLATLCKALCTNLFGNSQFV
jgi:hypothetical protein